MALGVAVLTASITATALGTALTISGWEYGNARPEFVLGLVVFACGWLGGLVYLTTMRVQVVLQAYRAGYRAGRTDSDRALQESALYAVRQE